MAQTPGRLWGGDHGACGILLSEETLSLQKGNHPEKFRGLTPLSAVRSVIGGIRVFVISRNNFTIGRK